ncbi:MAG: SH3 domain-containing protein, partial [Chloroflexota bacterium]
PKESVEAMKNQKIWPTLVEKRLWFGPGLVFLLAGLLLAAPVSAQTDGSPQLTVLAEALNIRSGPDASYPAFDTLVRGATTGVIGYNAKTGWWQVVSKFGSPGWVSGGAAYVLVNEAAVRQFISSPAPPSLTPVPPAPAAGLIVFQTSSGGSIYTVNQDGTNLRYLTTGLDPALSPDGRQVAFVRWDGAEFGVLYTIDLDGSNERAIAGGLRQAKSPTWSADGQTIIVSFQKGGLRDPEEKCKELDSDDGFDRPDDIGQITKSRRSDGGFVFCYIPKEDLQWGLRQINVTSGEGQDLPYDLYSTSPTWDPANPWRVVYDGAQGLVTLDLNRGLSWPLTADVQDHTPVISPDGTKIAVTYRQADKHEDIHVLNIDGSNRLRLTETSYAELIQQELRGEAPHSYNNVARWAPVGLSYRPDRAVGDLGHERRRRRPAALVLAGSFGGDNFSI